MDVHKRAIERLRHAVYKVHMLMVVQLIQQLKCSNTAHTSMLTVRYTYECTRYDFRTVGNTYSNRPMCMRIIWVAALIEMVRTTLVVETVQCVELSRPLILAIVY